MIQRRSNCPLSCWLDIVGDKWTILIIRDILVHKKKNYKEFIQSEEGISTSILATRLKKLVAVGIVTKTIDPHNKLMLNYELTQKGKDFYPIFVEITKWSNRYIPNTNTFSDLAEKLGKG